MPSRSPCSCSCSRSAAPAKRASLGGHSRVIALDKGAGAADPGGDTTSVLLVCEGIVGIEHYLRDGRRALSELCFTGDFIDCRDGARRLQGAVVALTDARLLALDGPAFEAVRNGNAAVDRAFTSRLREQARRLRDHCVDIGRKTPDERIASFLFEQSRRLPEGDGRPGEIDVPLTNAQIGDYLALQPETVSRSLSRLAAEGFIATAQGGRFTLVDEPRLRRIANGGSPRRRRTAGAVGPD